MSIDQAGHDCFPLQINPGKSFKFRKLLQIIADGGDAIAGNRHGINHQAGNLGINAGIIY